MEEAVKKEDQAAFDAAAKPEIRWAMMYRCPVCAGAMSLKAKKSVEVIPGMRVHPNCVAAFFDRLEKQRIRTKKAEDSGPKELEEALA